MEDLFNQPPAGQQIVYIGIDPGEHNGIAMYSKERGLRLFDLPFWKTVKLFQDKIIPAFNEKRIDVYVIIEATHKVNFSFSRHTRGVSYQEALKRARNAGMNQGTSKRLCEFIALHGMRMEEFIPTKLDRKWTKEYFKSLSGIDTVESAQHARDAARFIARFWVDKINKP